MTLRKALLAAALIATSSMSMAQDGSVTLPAAGQEQRGSRDQQAACRGDVRRLCRTVKPEAGDDGMLMCLKEHRAKLSRTCRALLESNGQ